MRGRGGKPTPQSGTLAMMSPNPGISTPAKSPLICYIFPNDPKNLYACFSLPGELGCYDRNVLTGQITPMATPTIAANFSPYVLIGTSDNKFLYTTCGGGDKVRCWSRNLSTGVLTQLTVWSYATSPICISMALSTDELFMYVNCKNTAGLPTINVFSRNASTGALSASPIFTYTYGNSGDWGMDIKLVDTHVYCGVMNGSAIYMFDQNTSTGALTPMTVPSIATGAQPAWLCIPPDKKNLYTANDSAATANQFARDLTTGALTALSPATVASGNGPWHIVPSPNNKSIYVAASDGQRILQYARSATDGKLTPMVPASVCSDPGYTVTTGSAGPQKLCVGPEGNHLYGSGGISGANVIAQFNINP